MCTMIGSFPCFILFVIWVYQLSSQFMFCLSALLWLLISLIMGSHGLVVNKYSWGLMYCVVFYSHVKLLAHNVIWDAFLLCVHRGLLK
jgi:hypothetical protein